MSASHHSGLVVHCGEPFDLMDVHVIHHYADCSVFKMPCCGREADDRKWVRQPYRAVRPAGQVDIYGRHFE